MLTLKMDFAEANGPAHYLCNRNRTLADIRKRPLHELLQGNNFRFVRMC